MTIQHTYIFTDHSEAIIFARKYSKIWFITSPIQHDGGWHILRYITLL